MKKLILLALMVGLTACAGQTAQQTAAKTLLSMHDLVAISAQTTDALCKTKVIKAEDCAKVKVAYNDFRKAWPIVDDALLTYMKAPATDNAAATSFNIANTVFIQNYTALMDLFTSTGVLKEQK